MGEAKRRGSREQRVALAVERERIEAAQAEQRRLEAIRAKHEAIRNLPPKERREAVVASGSALHNTRLLMAVMAGALAAPSAPSPLNPRKPQEHST